ncbi:MAG TPA: beta-N-acetylhexosaminidase [Casimicrobiaceae bacterium]|nr:beta-N-acetylhexosaminidase [Casimicrobiaceae bacterium]
MTSLLRGPVMLDVAGAELTVEDRERLAHPSVGGVILFARNYLSPWQLDLLTASIGALRDPPLLIAVDHEGGRVQRFRDGFTELPPMRKLGERWDRDARGAADEAERCGRIIALELAAHGVDFSFTPVLDLDHGQSSVIGDRAFHRDPGAVAELAAALCRGLRAGGMAAVGKHFPGHGFATADSHHETPIDDRALALLENDDLVPFRTLIGVGLEGVMPAHVVYPAIDPRPAGFSDVWLRTILRERMGFDGMIFSDDLSMAGAGFAGDVVARADAALTAGCDMVLVCNDAPAADVLLSRWRPPPNRDLMRRTARMERRR